MPSKDRMKRLKNMSTATLLSFVNTYAVELTTRKECLRILKTRGQYLDKKFNDNGELIEKT